jgi:hypothetical protein
MYIPFFKYNEEQQNEFKFKKMSSSAHYTHPALAKHSTAS